MTLLASVVIGLVAGITLYALLTGARLYAALQQDWKEDQQVTTLARTTDPQTSIDAALLIEPRRPALRTEVLRFARHRPDGFTDYDLGRWFGNHGSSYRTRRAELTREGLIVPTGERRTLPSGRKAIVWRIKEDNA